jgi:hypothetical protein
MPRGKPPLARALPARGEKHRAALDIELTGARGLEQCTITSPLDSGASTFRWAHAPARGPVFCLHEPEGRPSDQVEWPRSVGLTLSLGGARVSRPRPRLRPGTRVCTARPWAVFSCGLHCRAAKGTRERAHARLLGHKEKSAQRKRGSGWNAQ